MAKNRLMLGCVCALIGIGLGSVVTEAQKIDPRLKASLENTLQLEKKLTPAQRRSLSSATQSRFALAHRILETNPDIGKAWNVPARNGRSGHPMAPPMAPRTASATNGMVPISSPAFDYTLSRVGGFSQNDTSTAWCGSNIVTGYNDSSALLMTLNSGGGGLSFSGVAHSADGGVTFADSGFLDPGSSPYNFLVGNPSVACGDANHFYYASMFATTKPISPTKLEYMEAIGINISSDGGATWATPVPAVLKNSANILERESLAIDPSNPQRLFVSYTDIDFQTARGGRCAGTSEMLVQLVVSNDGGQTWGTPRYIQRICGNTGNAVNGSQIAVGPDGTVYVAYLFYDNQNSREFIGVRRSLDHGHTFQQPVEVATVTPGGGGGILQGYFQTNEYPALAVDQSNGQNRGTIYLAWTDGRNHSLPDLFSGSGVYNFADVMLVKSVDHGKHWSTPITISPAASGASRDQFMPGVAVDSKGSLAVCYSDRRNDPQNDAIDHYCSVSQDGGGTFSDLRVTGHSWSPSHATDRVLVVNYMQDYDIVSPDWTGTNSGFFAGFQYQVYGNPNVYGARF